jgi:hypothetical protein
MSSTKSQSRRQPAGDLPLPNARSTADPLGVEESVASLPLDGGLEAIRLNDYWPYQVTVLADRIARLTSAIVKREAGLNLSQWRVLAAIAEAPGRTAVEVVNVTPMDKGIVSRATKALLEAGLVVRRASQADGVCAFAPGGGSSSPRRQPDDGRGRAGSVLLSGQATGQFHPRS